MLDDITIGPGEIARLAQWRAEQEATPRALPAAIADEIRRRQAEIRQLQQQLIAYLGGVRDALGRHEDAIDVNSDDWTYTLRSGR